jgi:hypothetical protein
MQGLTTAGVTATATAGLGFGMQTCSRKRRVISRLLPERPLRQAFRTKAASWPGEPGKVPQRSASAPSSDGQPMGLRQNCMKTRRHTGKPGETNHQGSRKDEKQRTLEGAGSTLAAVLNGPAAAAAMATRAQIAAAADLPGRRGSNCHCNWGRAHLLAEQTGHQPAVARAAVAAGVPDKGRIVPRRSGQHSAARVHRVNERRRADGVATVLHENAATH